MPSTVFIDGAAGTTGLEIRERLAGRSEFALVELDDARRKDQHARREALNDSDFAILCLPDDAALEAAAMIDPASSTRIIDASSAHRVAQGWTYGFPEVVGRETVAGARRVSNPGCYPTGFIALIAPLVQAGLLPASGRYTVNAVSGYSGGGKALIERFAAEPGIAFRSYGLDLDHKHLPEMMRYAGLQHDVVFAPAVIPAYRGMIVEVPLHLDALEGAATADALQAALASFYAASRLVTVSGRGDAAELLLRADEPAWDGLELHVRSDSSARHARLIARLDNLGKGASGAAVQNLNLMAGLEETTGLLLPRI